MSATSCYFNWKGTWSIHGWPRTILLDWSRPLSKYLKLIMKVLVCGDRNWTDKEAIKVRLQGLPKDSTIIHGAARGADSLAGLCATELQLGVQAFSADWATHGKAAGPIRNRQMLDQKPDLVIAFHPNLASSKGTKDCVGEARRRGILVEIIPAQDEI